MRSKILIYIPAIFFSSENLNFQFKQIKELGFEQIVLDGEFVADHKEIEQILLRENLFLVAVYQNHFEDDKKSFQLMEIMHGLNCPAIMMDNLGVDETSKPIIQKIQESGITILAKKENFYVNKVDYNLGIPVIVENPLSLSEKPLQSNIVVEALAEKNMLENWKEKSVSFLIKPSTNFDKTTYLKHCKDILNRYFFLGVR